MRTKLLLLLLLFSSHVAAQEEEQWTCGADSASGFVFRNGDWHSTRFINEDALFTLDGDKGIVEFSQSINVLDCKTSEAHLYCNNDSQNFILDKASGRAGFSSLMGALIQSSSFISLFQCIRM